MRLLYIIPSLQHPTVRGPTRHYHFIRELSKRHAITLLTLVKSESEIPSKALEEVSSYVERLLLFPIDRQPRGLTGRALRSLPLVGRRLDQIILIVANRWQCVTRVPAKQFPPCAARSTLTP